MIEHGSICKSCGSNNYRKFTGEMGVHFKGIPEMDKPIVFVFSDLMVCLDCGHSEFTVPETELRVLETNTPVEDAAIVLSSSEEQLQPPKEIKPTPPAANKPVTPKSRTKRRP